MQRRYSPISMEYCEMEYLNSKLIAFCFIITLITVSTFAQTDVYKNDIIRFNLKEQAGKKEGNRILNDQLEIDVFSAVKDYSDIRNLLK